VEEWAWVAGQKLGVLVTTWTQVFRINTIFDAISIIFDAIPVVIDAITLIIDATGIDAGNSRAVCEGKVSWSW
jgi:hypothetical protein